MLSCLRASRALEIENGAEEVAEVELKASYMPDDYNKGEYEAVADELIGEVLTADNWMTEFSSETAQAAHVVSSDTSDTSDTGN